MNFDAKLEEGLLELARIFYEDFGVSLDYNLYKKISFNIFDETVLNNIKKKLKFVDVGRIEDYPNILPQSDELRINNVSIHNYSKLNRIAFSEKINSILFYTVEYYTLELVFLVDKDYIKKFIKTIQKCIDTDSYSKMFQGDNFKCKKGEYIEILPPNKDSLRSADVVKKKIDKEVLVYEKGSELFNVLNDIKMFFNKKTKKMYEKLQIPYKRGIIIYGEPGNGKSAMIRKIIMDVSDVNKIIISPNIHDITTVLHDLITSINDPSIIVIEDIDSLINTHNRSAFLNILDGITTNKSVYFIGTTNYPEKIDPAFMNRSGRFDRTYEIGKPSEEFRKLFFKSKKVDKLLSEYKIYEDENKSGTEKDIINLFVQYSDNLPMATLKELVTGVCYKLIFNENLSVEKILKELSNKIKGDRENHKENHEKYIESTKLKKININDF